MIGSAAIAKAIEKEATGNNFSGVIHLTRNGRALFSRAYGMANRADEISNSLPTRFAIASGSKIFTAVAICQLVAQGKLSFEMPLKDCLDIHFPHFDSNITLHHLLTNSSGIPDYWDEETQEFEDLWLERPMYNMKSPSDFLPMFQNNKMLFTPGEKFRYTDAGFIVLGLVVEQNSGTTFRDYVHRYIFERSGMTRSGYFEADRLPDSVAYGYIEDKDSGDWKTNIFAVPAVGGPDGGAYVTADDMNRFWDALLKGVLMPDETVQHLLLPHVAASNEGEGVHYGYGVWLNVIDGVVKSFNVGGWDPGVNMWSEFFPENNICLTILGNTNRPIMPVRRSVSAAI